MSRCLTQAIAPKQRVMENMRFLGFGPKGGRSLVEHRGNLCTSICPLLEILFRPPGGSIWPPKAGSGLPKAGKDLLEAELGLLKSGSGILEAGSGIFGV